MDNYDDAHTTTLPTDNWPAVRDKAHAALGEGVSRDADVSSASAGEGDLPSSSGQAHGTHNAGETPASREDLVAFIEQARRQEHGESQLIGVLHRVQSRLGYLSAESLDAVAQLMQVPTATVTGVATFYHFFRLTRPGAYKISVCLGTACYVKDVAAVAERIKQELGIDYGETSTDGTFTLEAARCLGTCGIAPVVMIGDEIHGQVVPDQIPLLLDKYRQRPRG
ncbi:MAG: NAD(P)H-dependent oxidoreductase subunit E [Phycisphaerae bacterium]|nr:NAD(P)H-dependent oxidoreductase subunit E [Phycisphaerae bacterium]